MRVPGHPLDVDPAQKSSAGKLVAGVALALLGASGLAMSLCGSAFTMFTLFAKLKGNETGEAKAWSDLFFVTGSVSFLFGLGAISLTVIAWQRVFRPR